RLRWYQAECGRAIARSVVRREGKVFTVMFARQMGKNETSAQLEAYLLALFAARGGMIVKAAPSFKPQIINSLLRLRSVLERHPLTMTRWRSTFGYMLGVGRASCTFLSADPKSNIVGATASLLLEIDEAQDVDPDKYDRDLRPMASSTNATTVLYGTAWSEDSILQRQKLINLEMQAKTGEQLHFEYDWSVLAAINQSYDRFVSAEIARLGTEHPSIRTQYFLECLADAGKLFSEAQRVALQGSHQRQIEPAEFSTYVMGIDLAGEDENAEDAVARALVPKRDSTVITIAQLLRDEHGNGVCRVVEHVWWTGRDLERQYADLLQLCERWQPVRLCVDASGIGAAFASFLTARLGERVEEFVFSAPAKSRLGYELLAMLNTGRVSVYQRDQSAECRQLWWEVAHARYHLRAGEIMAWSVPDAEGHDDFIVSLALCAHAANLTLPPIASGIVRAQPTPDDESRW
ncbi:MAG TPA: hypothetical protein VKX16_15815, partial [Chloroflexota bacterium]|nr:hypothetical protein [Chloroflexota bacterium]